MRIVPVDAINKAGIAMGELVNDDGEKKLDAAMPKLASTAKSRLIVYQTPVLPLKPIQLLVFHTRPFDPSTNPIPLGQAIAVSISARRLGIPAYLDSIAHYGWRRRKRTWPVRYPWMSRIALLTTQTDISVAHGETWVRFPDP